MNRLFVIHVLSDGIDLTGRSGFRRLSDRCGVAQVKGKAKYSEVKGVRTRRQVAAQGATATYPPVALPVKLMHVLVQLLTEADDAAAAGGDDWRAMLFADECEWESDEDDDDGGDASTAGGDTVAAETVVRSRMRCCTLCSCSDTVATAWGSWCKRQVL